MKGKLFPVLIIYTGFCFLVATLLVVFFFKIFPEKTVLIYFVALGFGLIFGVICYLPFKSLIEE